MHRLFNMIKFFYFFTTMCDGALFAAEIEVIRATDSGEKFILISGPIEEGDDSSFFEIAEESPAATVLLESPGGLVTTGLSIAAEIRIRGYKTFVGDGPGCHSICAIMWVAGTQRYMTPDAYMSVHAAYRTRSATTGNLETSESGSSNAMIGAFLNEVGLTYNAIGYFTFAGPNDDLLPLTPEIAQALSIDVYVQTATGITMSDDRPTPRRIVRQVSEYAALVGTCSKLFGVNGTFWKDEARIVLRRGHQAFGSEVFEDLIGEYVNKTSADIEDQGFVRWCLMAEQNLRRDGLQTGISGPSYNCGNSSTLTEYAICNSPDLWAMDRAMASLYTYYRENTDEYLSTDFLNSQRSWIRRRDQCLDDRNCLFERYSSRLFDFGY